MLSIACGHCGRGLLLPQVHAWIGSAALCGPECAAAYQASAPAIDPAAHRARALRWIAEARRTNHDIAALDALASDRAGRASKIIGLTKHGRRERADLERQASRFSAEADDARAMQARALSGLMGDVMALQGTVHGIVEPAVELAQGYPTYQGHPDWERLLAGVETRLTGEPSPPLARATAGLGLGRFERHRDGLYVYESIEHRLGNHEIWVSRGGAPFADLAKVEYLDGNIVLHDGARELVSRAAKPPSRDQVFGWVREERPEMVDAERAMTAFEAITPPGCGLLVVLAVGAVAWGGMALFDASDTWIGGAGGLTALVSSVMIAWMLWRLVRRPLVQQLLPPGG